MEWPENLTTKEIEDEIERITDKIYGYENEVEELVKEMKRREAPTNLTDI